MEPGYQVMETQPLVDKRAKALADYRKRLLEHREIEAKLKEGKFVFNRVIS